MHQYLIPVAYYRTRSPLLESKNAHIYRPKITQIETEMKHAPNHIKAPFSRTLSLIPLQEFH